MITILREAYGYELNSGQLSAKGLFNVTNPNGDVSFWFDDETKDKLLKLSDDEFILECMELILYANETYT